MKTAMEIEASLKRYPPIAPGTPDPYIQQWGTATGISPNLPILR
jgi:hypothetical protein